MDMEPTARLILEAIERAGKQIGTPAFEASVRYEAASARVWASIGGLITVGGVVGTGATAMLLQRYGTDVDTIFFLGMTGLVLGLLPLVIGVGVLGGNIAIILEPRGYVVTEWIRRAMPRRET